jgi:hypothetical protein
LLRHAEQYTRRAKESRGAIVIGHQYRAAPFRSPGKAPALENPMQTRHSFARSHGHRGKQKDLRDQSSSTHRDWR